MIIILVLLVIIIHMCLIWLWYRYTKNPSVVDVGWASGLTLSGLIYLNQNEFTLRTMILSSALLIWGARLGGYLWWTRIKNKHFDKRYTAISDDWKMNKPLGFFINFQLQGIFIFFVSICWYFTSLNTARTLNTLDLLGLFIFTLAILLESKADLQLQQFKKSFPGKVCNQGLWSLSRHPNYFFEWIIWCSFSIFAFSSPYGLFAIISPLSLYLIMNAITIPVTERESIKSRGESYIQYQNTTPVFFPKVTKFFSKS